MVDRGSLGSATEPALRGRWSRARPGAPVTLAQQRPPGHMMAAELQPEEDFMQSRITVTVENSHLAHVDQLADRLRAAGMKVDQVLGGVGIITGSVSASQRPSIEGMPGVAAVEDETTFQLPPPNSDVQ